MICDIDDHNVTWVIMNYYRQKQLYDSLITLASESNTSIYDEDIGTEILYLQKLILEGRLV